MHSMSPLPRNHFSTFEKKGNCHFDACGVNARIIHDLPAQKRAAMICADIMTELLGLN